MQNKTRWSLTLAAILLAACGGGEQPPIATITANRPQAVRAASVGGGQRLAIRVYQALYGQAPGNAQLSDFHSQIGTGNGFTWANSVASSFNNLSNTALSTLVLNNISITPTSLASTAAFGTSLKAYTALQGALADYFGWAGMDSRGIVIVQLSEIISNLEIDTQFGVYGNAAATFNRQTSANLNYSSNPANIISATLALATVNASSARSVAVGQQVVLDGTGSAAASGAAITYSWTLTTRPAGSAATLSSLTSGRPTFTPDIAGTYVATLIVNDGVANSNPASVSITAVANTAPVANAGVARNVVLSSVVTLDGSASSDANSDPLTYAWTLTSRPSGSSAALSSATSAKPTFTADVAGTYVASLTVNDGKVNSAAATVSITAAGLPTASRKLTDTGITSAQCYQSGSYVLVSCTSAEAIALNSLQDGMIGRDVSSPDSNDGKLGFSYSTVDNYPVTDCVKDNITGLMWEGKTSTGRRAGVAYYTNYGDGSVNDSSAYVKELNASALCGYTDWRLPSVDELQSLVNYGVPAPAPSIDSTWFPNTASKWYWTVLPYVGDTAKAWYVSFYGGGVLYHNRSNGFMVRLVR